MFGYSDHIGHLTSSGTIANLEALWVARELHPERAIVFAENAHYTHARMCRLIGARADQVAQDEHGRMDLAALEQRLRLGGVGTVVATLGTTSLGALDRLEEVVELCHHHGVRVHADAAYGGFFAVLADGPEPGVERSPFAALRRADSIVVDPHKHGLQPYGCGCVLFADPAVAHLYTHDSPYTYFTSKERHLGEISIECSRAGAAAAALWATLEAFPLTRDGLGAELAASRGAAQAFARALEDRDCSVVVAPELDIVCPFPRLARASQISEHCERAFDSLAQAGWHVAKLRLQTDWLLRSHPAIERDSDTITTLRTVLMKPSHAAIVDELASAIRNGLDGP